MSSSTPYLTPGNDPEMAAAGQKARKTFRFLWRELSWEYRRIIPALEMSAVKAAFSDPPEVRQQKSDALEVEYMWLSDIDFDGRQVSGTLLNSPHTLQSFKEGDQVTLAGKQLVDWLYCCGGQVFGGFTIDLMRSRMSKGERKQHDSAWGLNFGDPGCVQLVPPEYAGEAPKKKGLGSMFSRAKPTPQDPDKVGEFEHPMSVNMSRTIDDAIQENPALLTETDDQGFTLLHSLALGGSADGVKALLRHPVDASRPAKNGMTPFLLAKSLGWKKVMSLLPQPKTA